MLISKINNFYQCWKQKSQQIFRLRYKRYKSENILIKINDEYFVQEYYLINRLVDTMFTKDLFFYRRKK